MRFFTKKSSSLAESSVAHKIVFSRSDSMKYSLILINYIIYKIELTTNRYGY